jgi:citrate synthase
MIDVCMATRTIRQPSPAKSNEVIMPETAKTPTIYKGLENVFADETRISEVDGQNGRLTLRGYDITELAHGADFEEVAYLLWHGRLPTKAEYRAQRSEISAARQLPAASIDVLKAVAPHASGMHVLRIGASTLSIGDGEVDQPTPEGSRRRAARLQAQMSAIVAHAYRLSRGEPIVTPLPEHGLAEGFLYMLEGRTPDPARVAGLNAYFVAVAEHGFNASTFTGRCVVATDSDMVSGLTAAIGALKGPRHGGVPGPVLTMLTAIGASEKADAWIRNEMAAGRRIMGFGHRVYKVRDPRAALLQAAAEKMADQTGDRELLELTKAVEATTVRVLAELKPGRDLFANVELYAAMILHAVGIPSEIFTPVFGVGRTAGWTAHMIEQLEDNRLIRPSAVYTGPRGLKWKSMTER